MTRFLAVPALLIGVALVAWRPAAEGAAAPAAAANDTQKIVYLGEGGPLLIELRLRIDGQSFRARYQAFMDTLFDYLDRDRDGVLSRREAAAAPAVETLTSPLGQFRFRRAAPNVRRPRGDADGKVSRAALSMYYRLAGLRPFQLNETTLPAGFVKIVRGGAVNEPTAEELTDRLFKLLDTDGDGKLSRKELEAAPAVLGKLDIDEDEMVSTAELMGEAGGTSNYAAAFVVQRRRPASMAANLLHVVPEGGSGEALGKMLTARYGKQAPPEPERFADKPADVTLTVRLGNRNGAALMTLHTDRPLPTGMQARTTGEGATLQVGTTRLDLTVSRSFQQPVPRNIRDVIKTLFQRADSNGDGFVDRMEARRSGVFATMFDAMDRDGKGKVSEKDMLAYFDQMEALHKQVERSCVSLSVGPQGQGLFGMLDSNGDGKLSVRELRNAHRLLATLDTDGDGTLSRAEVPRQYSAALTLGPSGNDPTGRVVPAPVRRGGPVMRRGPAARGPLWFQKMDRNRDGDVSRKEFLGTDEQFREIDTDGDGLISVEEAEAYDRRKREGRERPRR
jgi:Ca2+-binding EF-hand superfamily protein